MILATSTPQSLADAQTIQITLPNGLIGLKNLRRFEATRLKGSWPFVSLRSLGDPEVNFLAMEPKDVVPNYSLEVSNEDAEFLDLTSAEDALIFNIITVHSQAPQHVTANLIGPILVNTKTLIGKQVIIANSQNYSTLYPLVDDRAVRNAA